MSNQEAEIPQSILISAVEYLLNVRQEQLAEALWEPAHRGDREWTHRLRTEEDTVNRFLQMLRTQQEQNREPKKLNLI